MTKDGLCSEDPSDGEAAASAAGSGMRTSFVLRIGGFPSRLLRAAPRGQARSHAIGNPRTGFWWLRDPWESFILAKIKGVARARTPWRHGPPVAEVG